MAREGGGWDGMGGWGGGGDYESPNTVSIYTCVGVKPMTVVQCAKESNSIP